MRCVVLCCVCMCRFGVNRRRKKNFLSVDDDVKSVNLYPFYEDEVETLLEKEAAIHQ